MPIRGMEESRELDKEKLRELAFIDDLTGLYNRRYLYQCLPAELKEVKNLSKELSLFMIDVDTFKEVNDTYGHLCGDKILMEIAQILQKSFREGDIVVRYAGDEFVAILPGAQEDIAVNIAKRVVQQIDGNPFRENEGETSIHVTISIGLAVFPHDAQDPEKLIYQADRALYSSKRSGRNCICVAKDVPTEILDEAKLQELYPCRELVGREEQLNALKELLDEAERGEAKFALIKGGRGIGKTRLVNEFKKDAQVKGITTISASCSPEISAQPYQILVIALENLFASLGPQAREFIRSLPEVQIAQLANYIPSLKQFLPEDFKAGKSTPSAQAQIDLFKGICQSLIYIVKRNTLLLIIDDFQWVDKGTLQLFNYIIKDLGSIPIFIVAAYRQEDLEKRTDADASSLKELLQQMKQAELAKELVLGSLKKENILKMITTIFTDIALVPEFVNVIYDISLGNALFTEELLRSLINKGLIFYQDGKWQTGEITAAGLPSFLKGAIQKRIATLDEESRPVISAAAVIGKMFDFDILCQLLEKNPGYILEVIDRVSRQHLIVPESPFQTDKFKFSSGALRDVIYEGLGLQERQDLHRKLALIEEKAYKTNIGSVSGTLGYHFARAQDTEKADLYSKIFLEKTRAMPTYEDASGFLQEALLEKAEEVIVPLSDVSMKSAPPMLRSLRLATQNVRLYPAQSTIRKSFIEQAYKKMNEILDKDSTLIISTAENRLLLNGEEISTKASQEAGSEAFVSLMIGHRIKGITFKKNLTKEHFIVFLEGLGRSFDDLVSEGGLSGILHKNKISLVRVNEVRYEQTSKLSKQRAKIHEAMLIDYLIGKISGSKTNKSEIAQVANDPEKLALALKKVAQIAQAKKGEDTVQAQANIIAKGLQKLSDQVLSQTSGGIERYRKNIAQAMMALDYKLRSKVIQAQGGADGLASGKVGSDKTAGKDVIRAAFGEFSDEEILEMVRKEFFDSGGNLYNLRNLIRRLCSDPQRRQALAPKLKSELNKLGMSQEEISWVLGEEFWQGLSLKDKLQRAIRISPQDYVKLQKEVSEEIDKLIFQLLEQGQYAEAKEIIDKLLKQMEDESKEVRKLTIKELQKISEALSTKEKYFLLEQVLNSSIIRLDKESDPQIYSIIAKSLASICADLIEKQNFIQATGILREFNLRMGKASKLLDIQKEAIKEAKDEVILRPKVIRRLTKLLKGKLEGRHDFWELSKVISEIGSAAVGPVFALTISKNLYSDPFKIYTLRWNIAKVLKGIGDEAVLSLKQRLADKDKEQVKTVLKLFGHMQNKTAVKYVKPLFRGEDLDLRKEAITTLGKIGGNEAIKLLSLSIKDKNSQIHSAAIWALVNIGTPEVLPVLKPLLRDKKFSNELRSVIERIEKKGN